MSTNARSQEELAAWDIYFTAAMSVVQSGVLSQPASDYYKRVADKAANVADEMLKQRRLRDPS
ncbi:MAG TPA: hypothetical protein VM577_05940 [Anaerovoracaceae bacterium]|nr:hypothetical protein [Anaerovoracaceae bacterium]